MVHIIWLPRHTSGHSARKSAAYLKHQKRPWGSQQNGIETTRLDSHLNTCLITWRVKDGWGILEPPTWDVCWWYFLVIQRHVWWNMAHWSKNLKPIPMENNHHAYYCLCKISIPPSPPKKNRKNNIFILESTPSFTLWSPRGHFFPKKEESIVFFGEKNTNTFFPQQPSSCNLQFTDFTTAGMSPLIPTNHQSSRYSSWNKSRCWLNDLEFKEQVSPD